MVLLKDCKLIRLEGDDNDLEDIHSKHGRLAHYEIKLITDKGTFIIEGCGECEAIFFEREGENE